MSAELRRNVDALDDARELLDRLGDLVGAAVLVLDSRSWSPARSGTCRSCRGCRPCRCRDRGSRPRPRSRPCPRPRRDTCPSRRRCRRLSLSSSGQPSRSARAGLVGALVLAIDDAVAVAVLVRAAAVLLAGRPRSGTCRASSGMPSPSLSLTSGGGGGGGGGGAWPAEGEARGSPRNSKSGEKPCFLVLGARAGAAVEAQLDEVGERVLGADAAVEERRRCPSARRAGRRWPCADTTDMPPPPDEDERRQPAVGDLAGGDVVNEVAAPAEDEQALAEEAVLRRDADAFELDREHRVQHHAEAQAEQRGDGLGTGRPGIVGDAQLGVLGEEVDAAGDARPRTAPPRGVSWAAALPAASAAIAPARAARVTRGLLRRVSAMVRHYIRFDGRREFIGGHRTISGCYRESVLLE